MTCLRADKDLSFSDNDILQLFMYNIAKRISGIRIDCKQALALVHMQTSLIAATAALTFLAKTGLLKCIGRGGT